MRRPLLTTAVAAALIGARGEPPLPVSHANLDEVRVIPVKPGHPREPQAGRFDIDRGAGVCYVREADWPKLQKVLAARKRAKESGREQT